MNLKPLEYRDKEQGFRFMVSSFSSPPNSPVLSLYFFLSSVGICHYMLVPQVKEVSFLRLYLLLSLSPL